MTAAARLARPRLQRTHDGDRIDNLMGATDRADWAEFVTLALASAAANFGGVEATLAGRSGSWEAEGIRQLLHSTFGPDGNALWDHHIEPFEITLHVDELLAERTDVNSHYDAATEEIQRRFEAAEAAEAADPPIDYSRYMWEYERAGDGGWVPQSPAAPPWSLEAWRASLDVNGADPAVRESLEASLLETATGVHIPKSAEDLAELRRLEADRDARLGPIADPITDLDEHLEQQRLREWSSYGEALKARVEAGAAAIPGLMVPVTARVDFTTFRSSSRTCSTT
ncbi:hypothetical protein QFZ75_007575 [Streptomyces sp. V3I8]|uniref:hypothetical protein n=1 Tax=Streptomyces sp. V3I8 TaxID=3042279 RepID=UPI0027818053|nr:hypothetical protein [Streptomyces sp. V3I8]MDQ1041159.1 hypothetical protein [Streptomyces sp. V3I8]